MRKATLVVGAVLVLGLAFGLTGQTLDGLAELHVQKIVLDPPSAVTRGEDVEVYARITNTGARNADQFTVGFFYRPAREGEPWILLGTLNEEHLRPSQQDFLEATFVFETLEMELGTYEIKVVADVTNQIPEVDELNNELVTSMELVTSTLGLPELQPVSIAFQQLAAPDAGKWEVKVNIANLGEDAQSFFKVQFYIDGEPFDPALGESAANTKVVPPAGQWVEVTGTLNPAGRSLDPGTYRITAVVDVDEQVAEQDEGNNVISAWLTLNPVELYPTSLTFDVPVVRLDADVRVTSTIANGGEGIAKNVPVEFRIDGLRFADAQIAQLGSEPQVVSVTLNADQVGLLDAPKVYEISVVVDPDDLLRELDEANNEIVRTLTILPAQPRKAELHPESLILSPASPVEQGRNDAVTVSSVIRNTGRVATGPFDVGFYYRVKGGRRWEAFSCSDPSSCSDVELPGSSDATLVGTLPVLALAPGIYEIRVVADAGQVVEELDENNNELVTTLTLLAPRLPDLAPDRLLPLLVSPSVQVQQGQTVHLAVGISNNGDLDAGPFDVQFSYCRQVEAVTPDESPSCVDSGEFISAYVNPPPPITIAGLGISERIEVAVDLETLNLAPGRYNIQVRIDPPKAGFPDGDVRERQEANNLVATQIFVLGADLVGLGMQAEWVPADDDGDGEPDLDDAGLPIRHLIELRAQFQNAGVLPEGDFHVGFYYARVEEEQQPSASCGEAPNTVCVPGPWFSSVWMHGLDVGADELVTCRWDPQALGLPPGLYVLGAYIDSENTVDEHFELNNRIEIPFELPEPAEDEPDILVGDVDLEAVTLFARRSSTHPEDLRMWATIANAGIEDVGPFEVAFTYTPMGDPDPVFSVASVPGLAAGETVTLLRTFDITGLPAGYYLVTVLVDPEDLIPELNEENNTQEEQMRLF